VLRDYLKEERKGLAEASLKISPLLSPESLLKHQHEVALLDYLLSPQFETDVLEFDRKRNAGDE
jgi:hypothetical protein